MNESTNLFEATSVPEPVALKEAVRLARVRPPSKGAAAHLMAIEIERKFLLRSSEWRASATGSARLRQAYLAQDGGLSTRVRLIDTAAATLTIKSRKAGLRAA